MSNKDVAFALELVARVLEQRWSTDPGDSEEVTNYTLNDVAYELRAMGEKLRDAPEQSSGSGIACQRTGAEPCLYHPLGGPSCEM